MLDAKAEALASLERQKKILRFAQDDKTTGQLGNSLDDEAGAEAFLVGYAPGHVGGVVGEAELAVGA